MASGSWRRGPVGPPPRDGSSEESQRPPAMTAQAKQRASTPAGAANGPAAANGVAEMTGVVLAGGRARRMGGQDKGLIRVLGRPMVAHIVERLRPQVAQLLINANRNAAAYADIGRCAVIPDRSGDYAGPLAGMASGLAAAATPLVLSVPCDSPLIAPELAVRLQHALREREAEIAVATDGERLQPVFALLRRGLLPDLEHYLAAGERKIDRWYARHGMVEVDFADRREMFLNINAPQDLEALETLMKSHGSGLRSPGG